MRSNITITEEQHTPECCAVAPERSPTLLRAALSIITVACVGAGLVLGLRWWTDRQGQARTYSVTTVPSRPVAIVFGAGVWPDGTLSAVLADRVETAVALYKQGKVQKILMTGDNSTIDYNEPEHMSQYAMDRGVPAEDIVLDYAGRRTYDSCYRAAAIFRIDAAILVTQAYHLDRALFTADALGIDVVGVPADQRPYRFIERYWWRELAATTVAWWQVRVTRPEPILGEPLPIFATPVGDAGTPCLGVPYVRA